jgi:hypothetical protein
MMRPSSPCLLYLAIILTGMLPRASAQPVWNSDTFEDKLRRSHLLDTDRFGLPAGNPEEVFLQRLKAIHTKEISDALRKKYAQTPEQLEQLLRNNADFLKERLKNFTIEDLPADLRKKFNGKESELEKLIQSMDLNHLLQNAREAQGLNAVPDAGGPQAGGSAATPPASAAAERAPSSESRAPGSDSTAQEPAGSEASSENQQSSSALSRWLLETANRFKDDPSLRNSPALRKAIRELSRKIEGTDERWKELDKGANAIAEKWARLGQMLPLDRLWQEKGFSWPRSLTPESFPNWRLPELGPLGRPASSSVGRPAMPNLTQSDGWRPLGMLAVLVALGVILQRVLARARAGGFGGGGSAWKLGPWPVQPTAVRTREELIRAFEYLSLLRLGPAARHWHHLAIASGLGRLSGDAVTATGWGYTSAERRQAALQLASLYERARYAPPGEPLPEAALATARRDLCLLAGVPLS